ncbi:MAG TPA: hypothetical protein VGM91_09170 [Conexibacter sp.]|jgi:hypothetical protein
MATVTERPPLGKFGPHHWQMLLVLENAEVARAPVDVSRLRCNPETHPLRRVEGSPFWAPGDGSALRDGTVVVDHDDYDCLHDLALAKLMRWRGTVERPLFMLTEEGWRLAAAARRAVAARGGVDDFHPENRRPFCATNTIPATARPRDRDAEVLRDETAHVDIAVGGIYFCFTDASDGWNGASRPVTLEPGFPLTDRWLEEARNLACARLERLLAVRDGAVVSPPTEILRCPECQRLLTGSGPDGLTLARDVDIFDGGIDCGSFHVVRYRDGVEIAVHAGGQLELLK